MRALLANLTVMQHDNPIRILNGRQTVRDDD
jgi:hypothetical protein